MPQITVSDGTNTSLWIELTAKRTLSHSSLITTSTGSHILTWSQSLSYSNTQNITALGNNQTVYQSTSGSSTFSSSPSILNLPALPITNTYSHPISFYSANINPVNQEIQNSTLVSALDYSVISSSIPIITYLTYPTVSEEDIVKQELQTRSNGSAIYFWNNTYYEFAGAIDPAMGTTGATEQWYSYSGPALLGAVGPGSLGTAYGRHIETLDGYEPALVVDRTYGTTIEVPPTKIVPEGDLGKVDDSKVNI
jgi:hypothetical protein